MRWEREKNEAACMHGCYSNTIQLHGVAVMVPSMIVKPYLGCSFNA